MNELVYIKNKRQDPAFKAKELVNQRVSKCQEKHLLDWNVKELKSSNIGSRNENRKKCLLLMTPIKAVIEWWIVHIAINHTNHLIRKY